MRRYILRSKCDFIVFYSLALKGLKQYVTQFLFVALQPHEIQYTALAENTKHGDRHLEVTFG